MGSFAGTVILASIIAHALLLIYVQSQRRRVRAGSGGLSLAICCSLLTPAAFLLQSSINGFLIILAQAALIVTYGSLVIHEIRRPLVRFWLLGGILWFAALLAAAVLGDPTAVGRQNWLINAFTSPTALTVITLLGVVGASLALLVIEFYAFYQAALPELANRTLYWVLNSAVVLVGTLLIISGTEILDLLGLVVGFAGIIGTIYALISYRVFDIRSQIGAGLRNFVYAILTAITIYVVLCVSDQLNTRSSLTYLGLALLAAIIYVPLRLLAQLLLNLIMRGSLTDTSATEIPRRYSQQISGAVELPLLVEAATHAINALMQVRRSALILVNEADTGDVGVDLRLLPGEGKSGYLLKSNLLYQHFASDGACLSQFDIEFNPDYKIVQETELAFFHETQMAAYAPIVFENHLIGILACGAKISDAPFIARDYELLSTLAHQTGSALRNARLVADLRTLNQNMQRLNQSLEDAKVQMERLDSVKTDFITIASHELRTPLAQVRGYTDIIDALNEQEMLDQNQMASMVGNLRKATERMEELIGAMLDVSQLDVNAMNLSFTQISLESVMRMAIEPLTDAVRQRKLSLSARGLRGLPMIQADLQRLVQAFRNVVVNAIKFTPDGGKIDISATLQPATQPGEQDHLLITVADTGVGIDKDNLELIFRKFYRAYDPSLHSTGTYKFMGAGPGLGLTIAQGVIEGHGGKIWAESPGHDMEKFPGTTFYILLPITPPQDATRILPFQMPAPVSQEPTLVHSQL
ncbi:MAG TPA: GAF domain-containing sensor histidine kinase [Phototrophicaceae bacterium]|nr:GAF domain-containing sensor histidine kinase [Phototrophicaceae bacterium]